MTTCSMWCALWQPANTYEVYAGWGNVPLIMTYVIPTLVFAMVFAFILWLFFKRKGAPLKARSG